MSSNIRVVKICEMCSKDFIAKKTTSKTCSDNCAKRLYKLNVKNEKIAQVELQTVIKKAPNAFVTEEQIRVINAKQCQKVVANHKGIIFAEGKLGVGASFTVILPSDQQ